MGSGADQAMVAGTVEADVYGYIDFSDLVEAYRKSTGCPLVKSDGDILQPDPDENVFVARRPTPQEARAFSARSEEPFMIEPEFEEVLDGF